MPQADESAAFVSLTMNNSADVKPDISATARTEQRQASPSASQSPQPSPRNGELDSSATQQKPFETDDTPPVALRFFLQPEISHAEAKSLRIIIKRGGGQPESRFGKANYVVVDPSASGPAFKLLRESEKMGQPIPVVTVEYIRDCSEQGVLLDKDDPHYNIAFILSNATQAKKAATASQSITYPGRNIYTEDQRRQIVNYFVEKGVSFSKNAASHDLAYVIPHTQVSIQTFLRDNFSKGCNLEQRIRHHIAQAKPAEPENAESVPQARPVPTPTSRSVPPLDREDDTSSQDIEVRPARTAATARLNEATNGSTTHPSTSAVQSGERSVQQPRSDTSDGEESEPEGGWAYTALRTKTSKAGNKTKTAKQIGDGADASEHSDSEHDELDEDVSSRQVGDKATSKPVADTDLSQLTSTAAKGSLFTESEKTALIDALLDWATKEKIPPGSHREFCGCLPKDFWTNFASQHEGRTLNGRPLKSWRSHYSRNVIKYAEILQLRLEQDDDSEATTDSEADEADKTANKDSTAAKLPAEVQTGTADVADKSTTSRDKSLHQASTAIPPISQKRQQRTADNEAPEPSQAVAWEEARNLPSPPPREEDERSERAQSLPSPPPREEEEGQSEEEEGAPSEHEYDSDDADERLAVEAEIQATPRVQPGHDRPKDAKVRSRTSSQSESDSQSFSESDKLDVSRSRSAGIPMNPEHRNAAFYDVAADESDGSDEEDHVHFTREKLTVGRSTSTVSRASDMSAVPRQTSWSEPRANALNLTRTYQNRSAAAERTRNGAKGTSSEAIPPAFAEPSRRADLTLPIASSSRHEVASHLPRSRSGPVSYQISDPSLGYKSRSRVADKSRQHALSEARRVELEKRRYRQLFIDFRHDFALEKSEAYAVIVQFDGDINSAWNFLDRWTKEQSRRYGIPIDAALDFLRAANGDLIIAESCMDVSARTYSSERSLKRSMSSRHRLAEYEDDDYDVRGSRNTRRRLEYH